jgi:hypothetical protein
MVFQGYLKKPMKLNKFRKNSFPLLVKVYTCPTRAENPSLFALPHQSRKSLIGKLAPPKQKIPHFGDALMQLHGLVVPLFYRANIINLSSME